MNVDYHIHSLYSDGIHTVEEIIAKLCEKQIEYFSLTDHDSIGGVTAAENLSQGKIGFITGVEITGREVSLPSIDMPFSMHLLGYGFDKEDKTLVTALQNREKNYYRILDDLCQTLTGLGYPVNSNDVPRNYGTLLLPRNIKKYLQSNYPEAPDSIFERIDSTVEQINTNNIPPREAVALIHNAGGKVVWAHPFYVYRKHTKTVISREQVSQILVYAKALGIDGLEANYHSFCEEDQAWLRTVAEDAGMFYTAGSDFHGFKNRDFIGMSIDRNWF